MGLILMIPALLWPAVSGSSFLDPIGSFGATPRRQLGEKIDRAADCLFCRYNSSPQQGWHLLSSVLIRGRLF